MKKPRINTKAKDSKSIINDNVGRKTVILDRSDNLELIKVSSIVGNEYMRYYTHTSGVMYTVDPEQLGGGKDFDIQSHTLPCYFSIKDLDSNVIVAMVGGHKTSASTFRLRVLHAFKPYCITEFAARMVDSLATHAKVNEGCSVVWNLVRIDEIELYTSLGFTFYKNSRDPDLKYYVRTIN